MRYLVRTYNCLYNNISKDRAFRFNTVEETANLISFKQEYINDDPISTGELVAVVEEYKKDIPRTKKSEYQYLMQFGFVDNIKIKVNRKW